MGSKQQNRVKLHRIDLWTTGPLPRYPLSKTEDTGGGTIFISTQWVWVTRELLPLLTCLFLLRLWEDTQATAACTRSLQYWYLSTTESPLSAHNLSQVHSDIHLAHRADIGPVWVHTQYPRFIWAQTKFSLPLPSSSGSLQFMWGCSNHTTLSQCTSPSPCPKQWSIPCPVKPQGLMVTYSTWNSGHPGDTYHPLFCILTGLLEICPVSPGRISFSPTYSQSL